MYLKIIYWNICSVFDKLDLFKYYFNYLNVILYNDQVDILNIILRITILNICSVFDKVYLKYIYIYYFNDNINILEFVLHFTMIL